MVPPGRERMPAQSPALTCYTCTPDPVPWQQRRKEMQEVSRRYGDDNTPKQRRSPCEKETTKVIRDQTAQKVEIIIFTKSSTLDSRAHTHSEKEHVSVV